MKNENTVLYLIKTNQEHVGLLKATFHKPIKEYSKPEALYLDKIYILKEFAGKGIESRNHEFIQDNTKVLRPLKYHSAMSFKKKSPCIYYRRAYKFSTNLFYRLSF